MAMATVVPVPLTPRDNETTKLTDVDYDKKTAEIAELIKQHPELFAKYLDQLRNETDGTMVIVTYRALKTSPEAQSDETVKAALYLLAGNMREKQYAGVAMLCDLKTVKPEVLKTVIDLTQEEGDRLTRLNALSVLGDWLKTHPDLAPKIEDGLLPLLAEDADSTLHRAALQFLAEPGVAVSKASVNAVLDNLIANEDPGDSRLAAMALGSVQDPALKPVVTSGLQQAFQVSFDTETRREFLRQYIYLSGKDSLEFLKSALASEKDDALQQDIREYTKIISDGASTADEIRRGKEQLDSLKSGNNALIKENPS